MGALLARLKLNYACKTLRVPPAALTGWLDTARQTLAGISILSPHKTALVPLLDSLSPEAKTCGSVNTVLVRDGKLHGFSTEGEGLLRTLDHTRVRAAGSRFTILGAGDAARGVMARLLVAGAAEVTICCRRQEQGEELLRSAVPDGMAGKVKITGFAADQLEKALSGADCLVNATPMGMNGCPAQWIEAGALDALPTSAAVHELVCAPAETHLLRVARKRGHPVADGLSVLIHQCILSLERLTDTHIEPTTQMLAAMRRLLMR